MTGLSTAVIREHQRQWYRFRGDAEMRPLSKAQKALLDQRKKLAEGASTRRTAKHHPIQTVEELTRTLSLVSALQQLTRAELEALTVSYAAEVYRLEARDEATQRVLQLLAARRSSGRSATTKKRRRAGRPRKDSFYRDLLSLTDAAARTLAAERGSEPRKITAEERIMQVLPRMWVKRRDDPTFKETYNQFKASMITKMGTLKKELSIARRRFGKPMRRRS
jgi:hypothetical protein